MAGERKYYVKGSWRTNLDSMHDHIWCLIYDICDGLYDSVELMGETMDLNRLEAFRDEVEQLQMVSYGRVTGKEYGRIKAISDERNAIRYAQCLNSGMNERNASYAFLD